MADPSTVYVGNLPWATTDEDLSTAFAAAGGTLSCVVQRHADSGRSKGWALVQYGSPGEAQAAVNQFDRTMFQDRTLNVRLDRGPRQAAAAPASNGGGSAPAGPPAEVSTTRLFVGNLSFNTTDEDLQSFFTLGTSVPISATVQMMGRRSKGWGLVEYGTPAEAEAARTSLEGTEMNERPLQVRYDGGPSGGRRN